MKKILSFLLAALMMTALLVGCGQQQADAPGSDEPDQPALADGVYTADFNTDSSMFHPNEACNGKGTLTVENGVMTNFVMNDKCAAGTGRFLEVMANTLSLRPNEMFDLARLGSDTTISSMCTVFAESEVIGLIGKGEPKENIAYAVVNSTIRKVAAQVSRMNGEMSTFCLTGGLCECEYIREALSKELGKDVFSCPDARYAGAIGAALSAMKVRR